MNRTARMLSLLLALALMLSLVAACGSKPAEPAPAEEPAAEAQPAEEPVAAEPEPAADEDKVITIGLVTDVTPMNCIEPKTEIGDKALKLLYPALVDVDENLEYVYQLAESVTTEDNLHFTIKVNPDAKWSDGEPITAEDVRFSFDVYTDPVVGTSVWSDFFTSLAGVESSGMRPEGAALDSVTVVDDKTLEVTCAKEMTLEYFLSLTCLNLSVLPEHVLGDVARADLMASAEAMACQVVSGPFYLYDQVSGSHMVYAANENYYKGCPKIDYLRFVFLTSAQISSQLASGEVDMVWPGLIDTADYDYICGLDNVTTTMGVPNKIMGMFLNNEIFTNRDAREAISLAIDRNMIVESVLGGYAEATMLPLSSVSQYFDAELAEPVYDVERARELLANCGWDYTQPFELTITAGNQTLKNTALVIVSELAELGFNITIKESDTAVKNILTGDYQMGFVTQTEKPLFPAHTLGINIFSQNSWTKYQNEHMDELYLSLSSVISAEQLSANMAEIEQQYVQDMPSVSIYNSFPLLVVNQRVTCGGPKVYGMFIDVEQWDVQ